MAKPLAKLVARLGWRGDWFPITLLVPAYLLVAIGAAVGIHNMMAFLVPVVTLQLIFATNPNFGHAFESLACTISGVILLVCANLIVLRSCGYTLQRDRHPSKAIA